MTIEQAMNKLANEWNTMPLEEQKRLTSVLVSAANKRIDRLGDLKDLSLAYDYLMKKTDGERLSVAGKQGQDLKEVYKQAKAFLTHETSTVQGVVDYVRKGNEAVDSNIKITRNELREILRKIRKQEKLTKKEAAAWKRVQLLYNAFEIFARLQRDPSLHRFSSTEKMNAANKVMGLKGSKRPPNIDAAVVKAIEILKSQLPAEVAEDDVFDIPSDAFEMEDAF